MTNQTTMIGGNNGNAQQSQKREPLVLAIKDKSEFEGTILSDYKSTVALASIINNIFFRVFKDYTGCIIEPNNNPNFPVTLNLGFTPQSDNGKGGEYVAFVPVGSNVDSKGNVSPGSIASKIAKYNTQCRFIETYEVTQDAVDLLYKFMRPDVVYNAKGTVKDFMSKGIIQENTENQQNQLTGACQNIITSFVTGLDIDKIIAEVYKDRDEDGRKFYYKTTPIRPIAVTGYGSNSTSWMYSVAQLNKDRWDRLTTEIGIVSTQGQVPIITAQ